MHLNIPLVYKPAVLSLIRQELVNRKMVS